MNVRSSSAAMNQPILHDGRSTLESHGWSPLLLLNQSQ